MTIVSLHEIRSKKTDRRDGLEVLEEEEKGDREGLMQRGITTDTQTQRKTRERDK